MPRLADRDGRRWVVMVVRERRDIEKAIVSIDLAQPTLGGSRSTRLMFGRIDAGRVSE